MKFFGKIIYSKNKARLIILLFVLFPLFLAYFKMKIPLMLVLVFFGILIFLFLRFDKKQFSNWKSGKHILKEILLIFIAAAVIMTVLIYLIDPSRLFFLAKALLFEHNRSI